MIGVDQISNRNILKLVRIQTALLFLMSLPVFAKTNDILINVFFNDKNVLIEKSESDFLVPVNEETIRESFAVFSEHKNFTLDDSKVRIENISEFKVCDKAIEFHKKTISFHDPDKLLETYTQCKYKITNNKTKQSVFLRIGLNRTFRSWCRKKDTSSFEIKKTVDAILDILHVKCCNDYSVKKSLVIAKMLNLADKKIVDVSPVGSFTNLRALWLNDNLISNITPLTSLKNLSVISLSNNKLSSIQSIKYLKNSRWVFLNQNHITKINAITKLENMKVFTAENNDIIDISPLLNLRMDVKVKIDGNPFDKKICKDFLAKKSSNLHKDLLNDICHDYIKIVPAKIAKIQQKSL
ncbi:leucine-rich repeat domain-containing protein [Fluviispira vulneris]|uniref:leucine-rich repeat domain-containing protein n=1 Tax=Fluviispira vulneris TaxID=2763012 RepID=UPI001647E8E9|nr:leucine-rich repeat domain-containing protein [Fluviispira vulneris]